MAVIKLVPNANETADDVIARAREAGLKQIVVIGWDANDTCFFDSNIPDGPPVLWLLEIARAALMEEAHG